MLEDIQKNIFGTTWYLVKSDNVQKLEAVLAVLYRYVLAIVPMPVNVL